MLTGSAALFFSLLDLTRRPPVVPIIPTDREQSTDFHDVARSLK